MEIWNMKNFTKRDGVEKLFLQFYSSFTLENVKLKFEKCDVLVTCSSYKVLNSLW